MTGPISHSSTPRADHRSCLLSRLADGLELADGLTVSILSLVDLDDHLDLLARVRDELAREGRETFLVRRDRHEQAALLARGPRALSGPLGLSLGVRSDHAGGRLIATTSLDLGGPFPRLDSGRLANLRASRDQVALLRSTAVERAHRRRGLARKLLELRVALAATLGRVPSVSIEVDNYECLRLFTSAGFAILDLARAPDCRDTWVYYLAQRSTQPGPATLVLDPEAPTFTIRPRESPDACGRIFRRGFIGLSILDGTVTMGRLHTHDGHLRGHGQLGPSAGSGRASLGDTVRGEGRPRLVRC